MNSFSTQGTCAGLGLLVRAPARNTLHHNPAPCTLHPAPCTLHPDPAPCTLHPNPGDVRGSGLACPRSCEKPGGSMRRARSSILHPTSPTLKRDWYSIAEQLAPVPQLARPDCPYAYVLVTVLRVSCSCEKPGRKMRRARSLTLNPTPHTL